MDDEVKNENALGPAERIKIQLQYIDHFFGNEQDEKLQSEQRIKYFLTLAAGIIALLSIINHDSNNNISYGIFAVFLSFLFLLGLFIFASIIWSDRNIKRYRELWTEVQKTVKSIDPSLEAIEKRSGEMGDEGIVFPFNKFNGTLTQIIWFTEGSLVFALTFTLGKILCFKATLIIILSIFVTIVVCALLLWWASYIKKGITKKNQ